MKILMTEHHHRTTSFLPSLSDHIKNCSNYILLLTLFLSGTAAGSILYNADGDIRTYADSLFLSDILGSAELYKLLLLFSALSLCICLLLFSSGLCLVGYPAIYFCPFLLGLLSSVFFCSLYLSEEPMKNIKSILILPGTAALICFYILLCNYSSEMINDFSTAGREVIRRKNYISKYVILTLIIIGLCCIEALIIILTRHIR